MKKGEEERERENKTPLYSLLQRCYSHFCIFRMPGKSELEAKERLQHQLSHSKCVQVGQHTRAHTHTHTESFSKVLTFTCLCARIKCLVRRGLEEVWLPKNGAKRPICVWVCDMGLRDDQQSIQSDLSTQSAWECLISLTLPHCASILERSKYFTAPYSMSCTSMSFRLLQKGLSLE